MSQIRSQCREERHVRTSARDRRLPSLLPTCHHLDVTNLFLLLVLVLPTDLVAQDERPGPARGWSVELAPSGDVFQPYLADPTRAGFAAEGMSFSASEIADSGDDRFGLKLGGVFGIVRWNADHAPQRGLQLSIEAGYNGQFDRDFGQDNIGWDGLYGLFATYRHGPRVAFKLAVHHISSHVGDEYAERTGRQRINYTREETQLAVSWRPDERWRLYGEVARAHELRNESLQQPGRLQAGVEHVSPARYWRGRLGWYAAANLTAWEERDWEVDTTVQAGLRLENEPREWRLGLEYHDGRSWIGEFFQDDERYLSFGLWLDL